MSAGIWCTCLGRIGAGTKAGGPTSGSKASAGVLSFYRDFAGLSGKSRLKEGLLFLAPGRW